MELRVGGKRVELLILFMINHVEHVEQVDMRRRPWGCRRRTSELVNAVKPR